MENPSDSENPTKSENAHSENTDRHAYPVIPSWKPIFEWVLNMNLSENGSRKIMAICTVIALFITGVYTFFAGQQMVNMGRQLIQMESATRPWIGLDIIKGDSLVPPIDSAGIAVIKIPVEYKNYGAYPAQNVMPFYALSNTEKYTDSVFSLSRETCMADSVPSGGDPLFPGNKQGWEWDFPGKYDQLIESATKRGVKFYVVGGIIYQDQFGKTHCTGFTRRVEVFITKGIWQVSVYSLSSFVK